MGEPLTAHPVARHRPLPLLDDMRVASPCDASWRDMTGDAQVRHCNQCSKQVFNISSMTRAEAAALIHENAGALCVKFYRRWDGTVMTSDCPVGFRRLLSVRSAKVALVFLIFAALSLLGMKREPPTCPTGAGMGKLTG